MNAIRLWLSWDAFNRNPTDSEKTAAIDLVKAHGLAQLCRSLLNANEFLYVF